MDTAPVPRLDVGKAFQSRFAHPAVTALLWSTWELHRFSIGQIRTHKHLIY